MKAANYFALLFIVLIQLAVLLLHLDKLHGFVLGLEGLITLGFMFVSLILLYGYKAEWEFISILGILFFCFNLLNFLFLYFMVKWVVLLFIGEVASIIGLVMVTVHKGARYVSEEVEPEEPKMEIIKEEKKFVASKSGKTYHKRNCPQAKRISRKNRVYFPNKEEANNQKYKAHKCVK